METNKDQELREALAVARDIYRQSVDGIDAEIERLKESIEPEIKRLKEQKHQLYLDNKKRRIELNRQYNPTTDHSVANNRKKQAYNIKRFIGGKFSEWKTAWLDMENAGIGFEMKEDCIQFGITIPYKDQRVQQAENEDEA